MIIILSVQLASILNRKVKAQNSFRLNEKKRMKIDKRLLYRVAVFCLNFAALNRRLIDTSSLAEPYA